MSSEIAIRVEGLVKKFDELVALDGIDFEVTAGTVFGLLGPNGAGKTTAIRILSTILPPTSGHAEVMGFDVVDNPRAVRCRIGMAGQAAAVDPNLTGRENLQIIGQLAQVPKADAKVRAAELLESFDLAAAADRPLRTYSGGMRRRLDVAAALVGRPPVIFLDEPTTGLDIQSRTELWERIRELVAEGATVLLTTQYLEEADQLADRIAVVDVGRMVANDTAAALKSRLASTIVEIGLADPEVASKAYDLLSQRFGGAVEREGTKVRLRSKDGPDVLVETIRTLDNAGLDPSEVIVHEPSLDDVFLALTGRRSESEQEEATARADA
jgi:ABC-2 type transport system ATP-binding protein